jgi:leucyl aminopeptidase
MTDFAGLLLPPGPAEVPDAIIHPVTEADAERFLAGLAPAQRLAVAAAGFRGREDQAVLLPGAGPEGAGWSLAVGLGTRQSAGRWSLAAAAAALPEGRFRLAEGAALSEAALHGWLMAQHRFGRYRAADGAKGPRRLQPGDPGNATMAARAAAMAEAAALVRDLVDTAAEDMGPAELEAEARALAGRHGARVESTVGEACAEAFPALHAVGRASTRRPRLIMLEWGLPDRPLVALVGKGVCFDSGGLDIKPAAGMALMKKDMGGAAHALALASLVMALGLKVRLQLVIAAVDNMIAGNALRPGDVVRTRAGVTVEVGNTDAEGRLVLADALAFAGAAEPGLILDFATLTGAARVALGPDLPALFANDEALAARLLEAADRVEDPLWRLPLWEPYRRLFRSDIADTNNVGEGPMAGAIIGALFLSRFVPAGTPWAHIDLYAWNASARPGRPRGGLEQGLFAALAALEGWQA